VTEGPFTIEQHVADALAVLDQHRVSAAPALSWLGRELPGQAAELADVDRTEHGVELSLRSRVRAGDHDAFGVLFEEYARAVYNHAFRLTGNWSTAEEVVSLTFLEAWRLRTTIRPEGDSLLPWLLGIALNIARNISRAARRHQAAMSRLPAAPDVPDFADELASRIDDAARLEVVRTALLGLRRCEREVLALCVWSGLNYAEAAEALGVPVGTVRSRLSRARRKLQRFAAVSEHEPGRELGPVSEQVEGDRENAIRSARGGTR
jgi:RNA polymerase sigma factor (sigma-70 family)